MKKCLSLLLALCLCLGLLPTAAFAAEEDFVIEDGVLKEYTGPGGDVVIPDSVTEIDSFAFQDCAEMTSVVIPDSVSVIREDAFYNCTGLTELDIPDNVVEIEKGAFSTCSGLKNVSAPNVSKVRYDAFPIATNVNWAGNTFSITNGTLYDHKGPGGHVAIPDGVTEIRGSLYKTWGALAYTTTSVTIPDSVKTIGDYAFQTCSLTSVTIPDSVTYIGKNAFRGCARLTSVTIPDSVKAIGYGAFEDTNLNSVTLPGGVTLDSDVFDGCENLRQVYYPDMFGVTGTGFPDGVTVTTLSGVDITGYNISKDGVLTEYRGPGGDVVLFDGITRIGGSAFEDCTSLTSVTIPDSVTEIGSSAFSGCTGLTSITIPDSVTEIDSSAFSGCTGLTSITIPSSVTKIGSSAFSGCTGLTSITIPDSVTEIGGYAFKDCGGLTSITIPDSVTKIGSNAFQDCKGLTSITISDSVTLIDRGTFSGCTGLTSITIPDSVKEIGSNAFYGCTGLTSVTIPDSVTTIGGSAFGKCTNLKTATVPSSTQVESYAFPDTTQVILTGHDFTIKNGVLSGYRGPGGDIVIPDSVKEISGRYNQGVFPSNVTGVTIPGSVTKIGEYAFKNCTDLTSVTISSGVKTIDDSAFFGCTGLTSITIPGSVISIGSSAFSGCTGLTSVTLGNGVAQISANAFEDCISLKSVTLPDSVTYIGRSAFSGCSSLATATVPTAATLESGAFPSTTKVTRTGHLFTIKNGVLSGYQGPGGAITIPDGVTRISSYAFSNQSNITSVTFPGSLTAIDSYAFSNCIGLRSVELPSSVQVASNAFPSSTTVNRVGSYFDVQSGVLKKYVGPGGSITIPDGVTSIGAGVFASRTDITGVTIPGSVTEIGERAFQKCTGLTRLTLGSRVATIGGNAFEGCTGLTGVTFPGSMNSIGYQAFSGCSRLTSLNIPGSVKKIGGSAFSGCTGLTSVTLGSGLTELGSDAFRGCTGLKSITIPGSVTRLNSGTLDGCTGLTSLTVSPGVKEVSLGYGDAPNLKALSLPDSVEKVSVSSSTLRELVIPAGVTAWPTLNCPRLTKLTFPKDNWVFKGISRANFMKNVSNLTALNTIVNCPNEFVDDLVAPNATIRSNWTNPKSTIVTQSNRITQLSREITAGCATDYDKAKAISQWVVDHIKYDDDYYYEGLKNYSDVPFDPEEILDKGNAVCAGYARLTQALLVAQKIPCLYVLGWTSGGYHAWNLAYLDGEYLWIDNTWGMDYFAMGVYKFSNDHKATGAASFNGVKGPGTLVQGEPLDAANMEKTSIGTALPETAEETLAREAIEALKEKYPDGMSWTNANSYYSEGLKSTGSGCAGFAYICSDAVFGKAPAAETHSSFDKIRVGDILRINNDTHSVVVLRKMSDGVIVTEGNYNGMIRWDRQISKAELEKGGLKVTTRWGTKAQEDAANTDIPAAGTAYPSTQKVSVDGKSVSFQCYALKDANGFDTNYIKLRDLADILSGTKAKFQVGWDGSVTITAGQGYTKNGSEQKTPFSGQRSYVRASAPTYVNGARAPLSAFVLNDDQGGGYTYYQLRDLGEALGFNVGWSADRGIFVETDKPYDANN